MVSKSFVVVASLYLGRSRLNMPEPKITFPYDRSELFAVGIELMERFCFANDVIEPTVKSVPKADWPFDACAYYRPETNENSRLGSGINVCIEKCQVPCGTSTSRNWTWPGSVIDREPYGVIAHELGHHCDWLASKVKGVYGGDYSVNLLKQSRESALTGYCPNPWEWFAEMFRLFVTNHGLLAQLRPRTYELLTERWTPVGSDDWLSRLGTNVPGRVVKSLLNKGATTLA